MSNRLRIFAHSLATWVITAASHVTDAALFGRGAIRYRHDRVPIAVLVTNGSRRRKIERKLRAGLRQLRHLLGPPPLGDIAVVVQQVIMLDRQFAGCYQLRQRPDGSQSALLRVALEVNHTRLSSDDLLAVIAEQWIAIANQQSGPTLLVPIEYESRQGNSEKHGPASRLDPLMPYRDDAHPHRA
ncbi:MAG: hypothetical protein DLM70_01405 [Chloroflexi bacterium]|nr:MAG: hypothetical protein DLM70_01405 [Chloroflexota bacterium]